MKPSPNSSVLKPVFMQTLESEEVDLNASLHGNWTLENAKARLNQFFQKEKITSEYKYSQVGPDHNRSGSERSLASCCWRVVTM